MSGSELDKSQAHKFFSADCFSNTWELIDKADRTPEEDEQMLLLAMASLWHWTQREDHTLSNLSVGYWQVSRVHALRGHANEARRYGQLALDAGTRGEADAFILACAGASPGATPRRPSISTRRGTRADEVTDKESKGWLLADLETI